MQKINSYKIVIPSAGLGSRVGPYSKFLNKALVTVGDLPVIARVIDKFSNEIPLIILLGYKGELVEDVVRQIYPNRTIDFVYVDIYDGPKSSLNYTLLHAKDHLQCPFIFIPNDTVIGDDIIDKNPNIYGNWAAYYEKKDDDIYNPEIFRTLELNENLDEVINISGKGTQNKYIYTGICGVRDYEEFWDLMDSKHSNRVGEVDGLRGLKTLSAIKINNWFDCGSLKNLEKAKEIFKNNDHNILEKEDEAIWFKNNEVIKFSINETFISDRVKRLNYLPKNIYPNLINHSKFSFKYEKVEGNIISDTITPKKIISLLNVCFNEMWSKKGVFGKNEKKICHDFYKIKTYERIKHYLNRFEKIDSSKIINDEKVPSVEYLLNKIDWEKLINTSHWSIFHGDLHGENIISKDFNEFTFLDWRQNFGSENLKYGDAYYDLAKIYHGLLVNHGIVRNENYQIKNIAPNNIFITINYYSNLIDSIKVFEEWIQENNFNYHKVKLLTALIFLNISGLHDFPYSEFLFYYGQKQLNECLINFNN